MFSQVPVILSGAGRSVGISGPTCFLGEGGYLWYQAPSKGVGMSRGEDSPSDMGHNLRATKRSVGVALRCESEGVHRDRTHILVLKSRLDVKTECQWSYTNMHVL